MVSSVFFYYFLSIGSIRPGITVPKRAFWGRKSALRTPCFPLEPNPATPSHPQGLISLETIVCKVTRKIGALKLFKLKITLQQSCVENNHWNDPAKKRNTYFNCFCWSFQLCSWCLWSTNSCTRATKIISLSPLCGKYRQGTWLGTREPWGFGNSIWIQTISWVSFHISIPREEECPKPIEGSESLPRIT